MLQGQYWEPHLLNLAQQALDGDSHLHIGPMLDQHHLAMAYRVCETVTRVNSKTFFLASSLLPAAKRRAAQALYAFCRVSDDLVDHPDNGASNEDTHAALETWREHVVFGALPDKVHQSARTVALALADARNQFHIPRGYMDQLIDGLALDLNRVRYETFADLATYCYGVACTVGLMSMHITGYTSREAIPYAIRLGVALQLTNILRDVGEDWRAGRLYLPAEELADFGLSESDIEAGRVDDRWRNFMRFQIQRARNLYEESLPGVSFLHPDGRFAIASAGELYRVILDQIEANDYDVFNRRASVSAWGKIRRLPGIWQRAKNATVPFNSTISSASW